MVRYRRNKYCITQRCISRIGTKHSVTKMEVPVCCVYYTVDTESTYFSFSLFVTFCRQRTTTKQSMSSCQQIKTHFSNIFWRKCAYRNTSLNICSHTCVLHKTNKTPNHNHPLSRPPPTHPSPIPYFTWSISFPVSFKR